MKTSLAALAALRSPSPAAKVGETVIDTSTTKASYAVILGVFAVPMVLLALRAGSDEAKKEREAQLRSKYAPSDGPSFASDFATAYKNFELENH